MTNVLETNLYENKIMNENINLCEILKGHEGKTFYSPLFGDVKLLDSCYSEKYPIRIEELSELRRTILTFNGYYSESNVGEIMLFPSKNQRDWNKWDKENNPKVPKTWSELIERYKVRKYELVFEDKYSLHSYANSEPIEKSALALLKIFQLIENGYGGNVTDEEWRSNIEKWYFMPNMYYSPDEGNNMWDIVSARGYTYKRTFAFHTKEQAEEFLSYPENVKLLKDYFII